jgi:hypothetical protein
MSRATATLIVLIVYVLHQDVWFWYRATPLVFGVLPIGLFYHVVYTLLSAVVLWALVRYAWPADLDRESPPE